MIGCRPLSKNEFERVLGAFKGPFEDRNRLIFVLGCCLGFRISELLSLKISSVFRHGRLLDFVSVPRRLMKGKRCGRTVPLPPFAAPFFTCWLLRIVGESSDSSTRFLFPSRKGAIKSFTFSQATSLIIRFFCIPSSKSCCL